MILISFTSSPAYQQKQLTKESCILTESMEDIGLPEEMQQRIQAVLQEHKPMPKQSLMDHVITLRNEAGLGTTEVQRPPSLMDHVIALSGDAQELRQ